MSGEGVPAEKEFAACCREGYADAVNTAPPDMNQQSGHIIYFYDGLSKQRGDECLFRAFYGVVFASRRQSIRTM